MLTHTCLFCIHLLQYAVFRLSQTLLFNCKYSLSSSIKSHNKLSCWPSHQNQIKSPWRRRQHVFPKYWTKLISPHVVRTRKSITLNFRSDTYIFSVTFFKSNVKPYQLLPKVGHWKYAPDPQWISSKCQKHMLSNPDWYMKIRVQSKYNSGEGLSLL